MGEEEDMSCYIVEVEIGYKKNMTQQLGCCSQSLARNSAQITTNIAISVQEQQHAEVQTDGGASHGHVLVADVDGDSTHVTNISVSVQEHQHEGGQQDRGEGEEHVLLDSGAGDGVQEEHVLVAEESTERQWVRS